MCDTDSVEAAYIFTTHNLLVILHCLNWKIDLFVKKKARET